MKNIKNSSLIKLPLLLIIISVIVVYCVKQIRYEINKNAYQQAFSEAKEEFIKDREINKFDKMPIKDSYKMVTVIEGDGDWVVSTNFQQGCKNLGWQCKRYYKKFPADQEELLAFHPEIILIMTHSFYPQEILGQLNPDIFHDSILFYYFSYSVQEAFSKRTFLPNKFFPYKFELLDGLLVVDEKYNVIKKYREEFFSENLEFLLFYPSRSKTDFKSLDYKSIFYASVNWDPVRGGAKYLQLYSMLDKTSYFAAYGPAKSWANIGSYKGYIKDIDKEVQKNGIYLLLHGGRHLNTNEPGIPTGRIFEAVANSAIIISDRNKFVIDNFGDNVLYIDQNASAEEMFKQIDAHYKWIISNPREAEKKAKKCHEIFIKKFTIEKQLQNLAKMYEFIKKKKHSYLS